MKTFKQYLKENSNIITGEQELRKYFRWNIGSSKIVDEEILMALYKYLKENLSYPKDAQIVYTEEYNEDYPEGIKRYYIFVTREYINKSMTGPMAREFPNIINNFSNYLLMGNTNKYNSVVIQNLRYHPEDANGIKSFFSKEGKWVLPEYHIWEPYNLNEPSKEMFGNILTSI
jgi:hypothetical protein